MHAPPHFHAAGLGSQTGIREAEKRPLGAFLFLAEVVLSRSPIGRRSVRGLGLMTALRLRLLRLFLLPIRVLLAGLLKRRLVAVHFGSPQRVRSPQPSLALRA